MEWNQMIPEFDVKDLEKSIHFYVDLIGFNVVYERKEDKFAFLQFENIQIMLQEMDGTGKWETGVLEYPLGRGINFQYDVKNAQEIYNRLKEDNYPIFVDFEEHWYRKDDVLMGSKEFQVMDPDGYLIRISEDIEYRKIEDFSLKI